MCDECYDLCSRNWKCRYYDKNVQWQNLNEIISYRYRYLQLGVKYCHLMLNTSWTVRAYKFNNGSAFTFEMIYVMAFTFTLDIHTLFIFWEWEYHRLNSTPSDVQLVFSFNEHTLFFVICLMKIVKEDKRMCHSLSLIFL